MGVRKVSVFLLSEAYQGKSPKLISIEKKFDILVDFYKLRSNSFNASLIEDTIIQIQNEIAEAFGFQKCFIDVSGGVSIDIMNPLGIRNAYTIAAHNYVSSLVDSIQIEIKDGIYRYKYPLSLIYMNVNKNLITMCDTGGEVFAIILHEIGHNFFQLRYSGKIVMFLALIMQFWMILYIMIFNGTRNFIFSLPIIRELAAVLDHLLEVINKIKDGLMDFELIETIVDVVNVIVGPLSHLANLPMFIMHWIQNLVHVVFFESYSNEEFADNFPSIHGYGKEISSALYKLSYSPEKRKKNEKNFIIKSCRSITDLIYFVINFLEVHPNANTRIDNQIALLKEEYTRASPKKKQLIKFDLEQTIKVRKDLEDSLTNNKNICKEIGGGGSDSVKKSLSSSLGISTDINVLDYLTKFSTDDLHKEEKDNMTLGNWILTILAGTAYDSDGKVEKARIEKMEYSKKLNR
jgi:hypothetical protein